MSNSVNAEITEEYGEEDKVTVQMDGFQVSFGLYAFVEALSDEQTDMLVRAVTWDRVLDQAVLRLTGESEHYTSDDQRLSLGVLLKVEEQAFGFSAWRTLDDAMRRVKDVVIADNVASSFGEDEEYSRRSQRIDVAHDTANKLRDDIRRVVAKAIRQVRKDHRALSQEVPA